MSDFSDVYDKLEEEPDKAPLIVRRLSKDVLEDLAAFVKRKMENFTADGGQGMDKEIEVSCLIFKLTSPRLGLRRFER